MKKLDGSLDYDLWVCSRCGLLYLLRADKTTTEQSSQSATCRVCDGGLQLVTPTVIRALILPALEDDSD